MRIAPIALFLLLSTLIATAALGDSPQAQSQLLAEIVQQLSHKDADVRHAAAQSFLDRFDDYFEIIATEPTKVREQKRREFQQMIKPMIPQLVPLLESSDFQILATVGGMLSIAGADAQTAVPALEKAFLSNNTSATSKSVVLSAILFINPEDRAVGPLVIQWLNKCSSEELQAIALELKPSSGLSGYSYEMFAGQLYASGHTRSEIPSLLKIANGPYPSELRCFAISLIGQLDVDARSAIPELRKLLASKDQIVRCCAGDALFVITRDPKLIPELAAIYKLEGEAKVEFEDRAQRYLRWTSPASGDGVDPAVRLRVIIALTELMRCENGFFRRLSIRKLGNYGAAARSALNELEKAARSDDADTRQLALEAIRSVK